MSTKLWRIHTFVLKSYNNATGSLRQKTVIFLAIRLHKQCYKCNAVAHVDEFVGDVSADMPHNVNKIWCICIFSLQSSRKVTEKLLQNVSDFWQSAYKSRATSTTQ